MYFSLVVLLVSGCRERGRHIRVEFMKRLRGLLSLIPPGHPHPGFESLKT